MPPTTEEWRARAHAFSERQLAPTAAAADRADVLPPSIRDGLAAEGFLGVGLPTEFGGAGGGARDVVAVLEELAVGSAAAATLVSVHLSVAAAPIARWGTAEQKERYLRPLAEGRELGAFGLTEPGAGSDAGAITTRYEAIDGGYRISGGKMFITNAGIADLLLLFATHDRALGHRGMSAFLVPRRSRGYTVAARLDKLGLRGSETTEIVLEGVTLPAGARLGPEGSGLSIALGALTGGRVGIAACALGVARAAYEAMVSAARADPDDWKRSLVARSYAELAAAHALIDRAATAKDAGDRYEELAAAAKLTASTAAVRIAHRGVEVAGRAGTTLGAPAERLLRDARVFPIVEGTTEIQELILGRALVGRDERPAGSNA